MKSLYYKGEKRANIKDENIIFINKEEEKLIQQVFNNNVRITEEESETGNEVFFVERDLSFIEKIGILLEIGFEIK